MKVLRYLLEGVQWLLNPSAKVKVAGKSAFPRRTVAGRRAAEETLCCGSGTHCGEAHQGAWYRQWRDWSAWMAARWTSPIPQESDRAFGRPGSAEGRVLSPRYGLPALLEDGTHVLWARTWIDTPPMNSRWLSRRFLCSAKMLSPADRFFAANSGGQPQDGSGSAVAHAPKRTPGRRRRLPGEQTYLSASTPPLRIVGRNATVGLVIIIDAA